jgi:uncharacterized membrane protein YhhN
MPVLAVGRDRRTQQALAWGWAGDVALLSRSRPGFAVGLGSFLVGHLTWISVLRERPGGSGVVRRHPSLAAPYATAWVVLNLYLWPRTGRLRLPVVAYSSALAGMALVALDTGRPRAACGGLLFMVSDSLLALERFGGVGVPTQPGVVMATYAAAQYLLASDAPQP